MSKQTIAVIVGAVVVFFGAVAGTLAFTGGGSESNVHMMPAGQMMTGPMHTMSNGAQTPGMQRSP